MKLPRYSTLFGLALIATARIHAQAALDPFSLEFEFPTDSAYADSFVTWTEVSPGVFQPTDWDIHGPLGEFTPGNSAIDSSSLGSPGFFLTPTEIPLDQLNIVDTDPPI